MRFCSFAEHPDCVTGNRAANRISNKRLAAQRLITEPNALVVTRGVHAVTEGVRPGVKSGEKPVSFLRRLKVLNIEFRQR
jgi:hypothetical protein